MTRMIPGELASRIGEGLLAFPVTHFDEQGEFVEGSYLEIGVSTYSSAIFNFLPHFAQEFYSAVRRREHATVFAMLRDSCFLMWPFAAAARDMQFRSQRPG